MSKYLLYLLLLLPLLSCDKEADFRSSELQAPVVTGISVVGAHGEPGPVIGKPNDKDFDDTRLQLFVGSNPAYYHLSVYLSSPTRAEAKVWLVQATIGSNLAASLGIFNTNPVIIGGLPLYKAEAVVDGNTYLNLDVYNLPAGVYRLYIQIGDQLAWRNIWKL